MGVLYPEIDERLAAFIKQQHMFFVATAPLRGDGHINLSPKGLDTLAILDPHTVAYLDLTGSGIETVAQLKDNGRIAIMFCSFEGPPKILRLHGRGRVIEPGDPDFEELRELFPPYEGIRSVVSVALKRVADSCGFGVPLFDFVADRAQLPAWVRSKGLEKVAEYRAEVNTASIDGLLGLKRS